MRILVTTAAAILAIATPAMAEVYDSTPSGFTVRATATVPASVTDAWDELLDPADWWNGTHTFSGNAANLSLDPRAGGCFCELLLNVTNKEDVPRGGVQHMQVVYIEKPRTLRLSGALGPLQSEPVVGTLTFMLKQEEAGTRINAEYAVGGYMRIPAERMAPLVDRMINEQVGRLAKKLGGAAEAPKLDNKEAPSPLEPTRSAKPIVGR